LENNVSVCGCVGGCVGVPSSYVLTWSEPLSFSTKVTVNVCGGPAKAGSAIEMMQVHRKLSTRILDVVNPLRLVTFFATL